MQLEEFTRGFTFLLSSKYIDKIRLVFEMLDFDSNKLLTKEELKAALSQVPLSTVLLPATFLE